MPPGYWRDAFEHLGFFSLSCFLCCCVEGGKNVRVTINDAVGNESRAFTPDMLFKFRPDPELTLVIMEYRSLRQEQFPSHNLALLFHPKAVKVNYRPPVAGRQLVSLDRVGPGW
jgi:hypothetical protein